MKKLLFLFLVLPALIYGRNWYVSTSSSGSAAADSWANKRALSSFTWAQVAAGDTVFIDGGTDSLIYNQCIYIGSGTLAGTISNKIVVTKGKDAGHNGKAILGGNTSSMNGAALYAYGINYTEWSYLNFIGASDNTTSSTIVTVGITNSRGVDILHCDIKNDASDAVVLVSCQDIRVMYNNIYNNKNCQWATDGFHIDGSTGKNLEIAYNTISSSNPQNVTTIRGHKDLIQFALGYGSTGGTVKIHHNFFNDYSNSSKACGIIYAYDVGGNFEIYNNVLFSTSNAMTGMLQIQDPYNYQTNAKIYNNTFYAPKNSISPLSLYGIDSLTFVNNILHLPTNWVGWMMDYTTDIQGAYKNINYNQYYVNNGDSGSSSFAYMHESWDRISTQAFGLSWAQWKARGYDVNGSYFKPAQFKNAGGTKASDYKLMDGSRGINEGRAQTLFNDDLEGTIRPVGGIWDKGAFEFNNGSTGGDIIPPKLMGAVIINSTSVELTFSEPLETASAINKSNYSINNGVIVNSAALSTDGKKVTLTTAAHPTGNFTVTVINVKDLAGNVILSTNNTAQYAFSSDLIPPKLLSAVLLDPAKLELTFSEPLETASAVNASNYSINNGINISSAVLATGGLKVTLSTSTHPTGSYVVTVNNVKDLAGNVITTNNTFQYSVDTTPPGLLAAISLDSVNVELTFSEALESISANNKLNYTISNNIVIQSAILSSNLNKVTLRTSPHTSGQTYTATVQNVKDLKGNVIQPPNNTKQFTCSFDNSCPVVTGLGITSQKAITINFSERLNRANATNTNNYSISNVIVHSVELLPDSSSVQLKTSNHIRGTSYALTISNVTDKAGNAISPNPKIVNYIFPKKGKGNIVQYPIGGAETKNWFGDFLPKKSADGEGMIHPDSRWLSNVIMPDTINYDLEKVCPIDSMRISFFGWESNRYKYSLYSSEDSENWQPIVTNIWSDNTEWTEIEFELVETRYIRMVLLESSQSAWGSIWEVEVFGKDETSGVNTTEMPETFKLSQNYPNPFNPSTKIVVSLPQNSHVRLTIYNSIGELVGELANADFNAGNHEFYFDAAGLASGIYIYRIDTPHFVETKKMVLLR